MISNWQPAQSLVGDVVSGADITAASCLLPLDDAKIPLCLHGGKGQKWQLSCTPLIYCNVPSLVLWVCQFSPCSLRDFSQERSFFLHFCLWYSQSLACYITLALSDCPQSIKARILTIGQKIQPKQPSQAHINDGGQEHLCFFSAGNCSQGHVFLFFFPLVMLLYVIPEFTTVTDLRGFIIACNLLLLYNFLFKMGLNP